MRTVLFVGAGIHQRRAIARAHELGLRVVAVDGDADAPGLRDADAGVALDFSDVDAVAEVGRRHRVEGVLTVASDRAVPVVAAVAELLGLPGIGRETAHRMTNKLAMRRALGEAGVPQPEFVALPTDEAPVGFPAVLKPADSSGQRGIALVSSPSELNGALDEALAASTTREAILERYHDGREVNTLVVARRGFPELVTASDRLRPAGRGFGVALAHVYPTSVAATDEVERVALAAVRALGLRDGIAYPQLLVSDDGVRVVEVAARVPGGQMGEVARYGVGVDLVEVALRQALGEEIPDSLARPRFVQPLAIRFLTADPGPLPVGRVTRVGTIPAAPGVERAEVWLAPGDEIRAVRVDGDRRGYVIATAETPALALERADAAASLLDVEVEATLAAPPSGRAVHPRARLNRPVDTPEPPTERS